MKNKAIFWIAGLVVVAGAAYMFLRSKDKKKPGPEAKKVLDEAAMAAIVPMMDPNVKKSFLSSVKKDYSAGIGDTVSPAVRVQPKGVY